jgi:formiminotetrahydrofolate cyclodeaminase
MPELSATSISDFLRSLSDRTPTPGGGAAAALTAAIGSALGAMAARYTTGKKWADREEEARALGDELTALSVNLTALAQKDAEAYSALSAAKIAAKNQVGIDLAPLEAASAQVPLDVLGCIHRATCSLSAFRSRCNPHLLVDLNSAVFLLAGAARASAALVCGNGVDEKIQAEVAKRVAQIESAEKC